MQKNTIANKQWVSPNEAAGFLSVCTKTLRLHDQALKPAYLNSRVKRYHLPSLEKFLEDRRIQ